MKSKLLFCDEWVWASSTNTSFGTSGHCEMCTA